jgi:hypothetical protein
MGQQGPKTCSVKGNKRNKDKISRICWKLSFVNLWKMHDTENLKFKKLLIKAWTKQVTLTETITNENHKRSSGVRLQLEKKNSFKNNHESFQM